MRVAAFASDCYLRARKLAVGPGVQVLSPAAGSSHDWSSCRAVIVLGMNRLADALFAANETKLTPERLIAEAAKGTRLDAKPFSDPHLVEALALSPPVFARRRRCRPSGTSRPVGISS